MALLFLAGLYLFETAIYLFESGFKILLSLSHGAVIFVVGRGTYSKSLQYYRVSYSQKATSLPANVKKIIGFLMITYLGILSG